jgi:hypothetical protein
VVFRQMLLVRGRPPGDVAARVAGHLLVGDV